MRRFVMTLAIVITTIVTDPRLTLDAKVLVLIQGELVAVALLTLRHYTLQYQQHSINARDENMSQTGRERERERERERK